MDKVIATEKAKTTVITMFFNLKKLKDASTSTRPLEFYMEHGRHTLSVKYPMIVFCDEETIDMIRSVRESLGADIPTTYVVKPFMDYDYYSLYFDIIKTNRENGVGYKDPSNRNTPSYFLVTMFKIFALKIAEQMNPYHSDYFAWIDFGGNHILQNIAEYAPKMLDNPKPKVAVCYIHYRSHEELNDIAHYLRDGGPCGIAATAFTVEQSYVNHFFTAVFQLFHEHLYHGVGHSEESIFAYCYDRYPDLFTLHYGDYCSVLTNYHTPTQSLHSIKIHFIYNAFNAKRYDLVRDCIGQIMESLEQKKQANHEFSAEEWDAYTELGGFIALHLGNLGSLKPS